LIPLFSYLLFSALRLKSKNWTAKVSFLSCILFTALGRAWRLDWDGWWISKVSVLFLSGEAVSYRIS
jgi:hypothetical protein